jgi:soluble lytic murein transglycosylase
MAVCRLIGTCLLLAVIAGNAAAAMYPAAGATMNPEARLLYSQAEAAIAAGDWQRFEQLRAQLDEYPLALYLDYQRLDSRLRQVPGDKARLFLETSADTPLQLRFKGRYLRQSGKDERWDDLLAVTDSLPNTTDLQCYYYLARLAQGDSVVAWQGARDLWAYGKSQSNACDPLFKAWIDNGQIDDEAVWQRQLLAFDARHQGLMIYVGDLGSEQLQSWTEQLLAVYRRPHTLATIGLPAYDPRSLDIYTRGLARYARVDANRALGLWLRLLPKHNFSTTQMLQVQDALAWQTLRDGATKNRHWLDQYLAGRGNMKLLEARLRLAIRQSDWTALLEMSVYLDESTGQLTAWRYWNAHASAATGQALQAVASWKELAAERDYYGFLAAEKLALPYQLNNKPLLFTNADPNIVGAVAVQRTGELMYHGKLREARSEWNYLLPRVVTADRAALSHHARQQGWYRFAIDAAIEAQAWDALELRFPQPYTDFFQDYGQRYGVPDTELLSIARRESAFFSHARSEAGARGIMQLLPSTARRAARSLGQQALASDLYQVDANIALGGAYYRQLLDAYDNNRVLSLAAYNAGPQRVRRWLRETDKTLDVYQWVETIPFPETRSYVQAVLAYNVVYDRLRQGQQKVFLASEIEASY